MGTTLGDKGQVHERGWDGEYRPVEGFLGPKEAEPQRSLLTGDPVPATDLFGNQKHSADGAPLYKAQEHSTEDALAGAAGVAIFAIVVAALAAAAAFLGWAAGEFTSSAKSDLAEKRVSLRTVAFGSILGTVGTWVVGLVVGPSGNGPLPGLVWVLNGLCLLVAFLFAALVGPTRAGRLVRASVDRRTPVDELWRWVGAAVATAWFTVILLGQSNQSYGSASAVNVAFVVLIGAAEVAAFAWGWQGQPDLVAMIRAQIAAGGERAAVDRPAAEDCDPSQPAP